MTLKTAKTMVVTLQGIKVNDASGDGGDLEISGDLFVKGLVLKADGTFVDGSSVQVFHVESPGLTIHEGSVFPLGDPANKNIANMVVFEGDFLGLGGALTDHDAGPDDLLGDGFRKVRFDEIKNETIGVGFSQGPDDHQDAVAIFLVDQVQVTQFDV